MPLSSPSAHARSHASRPLYLLDLSAKAQASDVVEAKTALVADSKADRAQGSVPRPEDRRPVWPVTLLVVACAYLLSALNLEPIRAVTVADLFDDLTHLNWVVARGLAVVIGGVLWTRRVSRPSAA